MPSIISITCPVSNTYITGPWLIAFASKPYCDIADHLQNISATNSIPGHHGNHRLWQAAYLHLYSRSWFCIGAYRAEYSVIMTVILDQLLRCWVRSWVISGLVASWSCQTYTNAPTSVQDAETWKAKYSPPFLLNSVSFLLPSTGSVRK